MRRNISANIVSIGSMRIARRYKGGKAAVEEEDGVEVEWLLDGPFHIFLRTIIARGENRLLL